jgi:paraquat-inducible protein A
MPAGLWNMSKNLMIACHECDLLYRLELIPEGSKAVCSRCGALLYAHKPDSLDKTLSLVIAGLILFFLSNIFPLLEMKNQGLLMKTTLSQGVRALYNQDMEGLAALVLITCILAPLIQLGGLLYVLLPLKYRRAAPKTPLVFRWIRKLQPWSMMEVFMLGILVSIIKLAKMGTIIPGLSLYSFGALIVVLAWANAALDPHTIWEKTNIKGIRKNL